METNRVGVKNFGVFAKRIDVFDERQETFVAEGDLLPPNETNWYTLSRDPFTDYSNVTLSGVNAESGNDLQPVNYGLVNDGDVLEY